MSEINKDKNPSNEFDEKSIPKKNNKKLKSEEQGGIEKEQIIADLKIKLNEVEDKLLRELAENDNLRKRHEKDTRSV